MIEIHGYFVAADIEHTAHNAVSFGGHHRYGGADLNGFAVEFAINYEYFAVEVYNFFFVVSTESLFAGDRNVKSFAYFQAVKSLFEGLKDALGHAEDYALGVIGICLIYCHLCAVGSYLVEVISQFNVHAGGDFRIVVLHCVYI